MSTTKVNVSLSELLRVRGKRLLEPELWSILAIGIMAIQELCLTFGNNSEKAAVITPDTLLLCSNGEVKINVSFNLTHISDNYIAPEIQKLNSTLHLSSYDLEKTFIYSFGKTLRYGSEFTTGISTKEHTHLSVSFNHILNSMHSTNVTSRCSLASLFEYVECNAKLETKGMPFSCYIFKLYDEALRSIPKMNMPWKPCIEVSPIIKDAVYPVHRHFTNDVSAGGLTKNEVDTVQGNISSYDTCRKKTRQLTLDIAQSSNLDSSNSFKPGIQTETKSATKHSRHKSESYSVESFFPASENLCGSNKQLFSDNCKDLIMLSEVSGEPCLSCPSNEVAVDEDMVAVNLPIPSELNQETVTSMKPVSCCVIHSEKTAPNNEECSIEKQVPELHLNQDLQTFVVPEFIQGKYCPIIKLSLPKNGQISSAIKSFTVVTFTGQRYEVECNPTTTTAGDIFQLIVEHQNLKEKFLLGLAFLKGDEFIFLELDVTLYKLMLNRRSKHFISNTTHFVNSITLYLRIKFYINVSFLRYPSTKHTFYLQLRKDVLENRISSDVPTALLIASFALQAEQRNSDYNELENILEYYVPNWIVESLNEDKLKWQLRAMHKSHQGLSSESAEEHFISKVQGHQDYGFHFHKLLWDKKNPSTNVILGISPNGISISNKHATSCVNKLAFQHYPWQSILQISFVKQVFYISIQHGSLRRHPRKYRFFSEENLGKYLFNLTLSHHRLHLRLHYQTPDHSESLHKCTQKEIGVDEHYCDTYLGSLENIREVETSSKKIRSKFFNLSKKRDSVIRSTTSSPTPTCKSRKRLTLLQQKKIINKPRFLSMIFKNQDETVNTNNTNTHSPTNPVEFNDTVSTLTKMESNGISCTTLPSCLVDIIEKSPSVIPLEDSETAIDLSLAERFANMTGIEKLTERKIVRVTLKKDDKNSLGITVFEGADGATYIQSIHCRHSALNLQPGDRIMAVNGKDVQTRNYKDVVDVLRGSGGVVQLMLSQVVNMNQLALASNIEEVPKKHFMTAPSSLSLISEPSVQKERKRWNTDSKNDVHSNNRAVGCHSLLQLQRLSIQPSDENTETLDTSFNIHDNDDLFKNSSAKFQMDSFLKEVSPLRPKHQPLSGDGKLTTSLNQFYTNGNPAIDSDVLNVIDKSIKPRSIPRELDPSFVFHVVLEKINGDLGIRLVSNTPQMPDKQQNSIVIESLTPNGAAARDGRIRPGDAIVEVGGVNVCGLSHCEVIGRLRGAPQVVHLAVRRTSTPTDNWHNGSQNIIDGDQLTGFQATADRHAGEPTSVRSSSSSSSSCSDKASCALDGSNAEVGWHSKTSHQNQVKLTKGDSRNGSTMVSKLNKPSSTEPIEREGPQRHRSSHSECSTPDMVQSGTTRTVLWEPKVSGSVKSRISNFEAHLQPSQGWMSPLLLGRKPLSQSSQELGHEKVAKKFGPLQKFPSLPESQSTVDALEPSVTDGQWCSAIVSKPYRPRFAPRLMRSQTMPTVCQGSSSSVAATTDVVTSVVASSGSQSPNMPETPPPWFAELRSRKLQQRPPWWSRANSVDESGGAGIPPKSPDSTRRKTVSPTLLSRRFTLEVTATSNGDSATALATPMVRRQSSSASLQRSPVALVSPIQKPSLRPLGSFETKTRSTDEPKNRTVPQTNGFSKASVQVTRSATVHQLTRSFEVPFQRDVTKKPDSLALFHQDAKLDELHRQFHFINKESVFDVSLVKNSRGLGISICGGNDQDPGDLLTIFIRIKKLYPLQPALESGRLEVGDIILKVNGRHLTNLKHSEAVDVLRIAPANVVLLICRPPPGTLPPVPQNDGALVNSSLLSLSSLNLLGLGNNVVPHSKKFPKESIVVLEKINGSLGFTLHKKDEHHPGHFIKALVKEPALSDGRLQPGDQILEVNGVDISRLSHDEAINALRASPNQVTLTVRRSDDQTMSPLSPLSPTSPLSHDIPNGRHDKKILRKEAQDLLSDNSRKRNSGIVSGPYEAPIARRHRHKGRSSPSAISGDSASDIAESLSSTSDADSRRTTPTLTRRNMDRPESNKSDSGSQQTDLSRDSSMNSLMNGTAEMSTNKMSRPMSLDLNEESRKKGEQLVLNCALESNYGPSRVPSLCVSKWESDSTASADDTDTDSSGNAKKQLVLDEQNDPVLSSLMPPNQNLRHSMSDGNCTFESRKSLVQQPWHSSADSNVQGLKKWRGTELPFPVKTEHQSKTVTGGNMSQDAFIVELDRYWNSRLGFSLISVEIGKLKGSFIRAIHPDSLASRDGRLKPGDQILKVNDVVISGMNTDDVIEMLRKLKGKITLAVVRNPAITNSVLTLIHLQSS